MDPVQQNVSGVNQLVGSKVNKVPIGTNELPEGVEGEKIDALTLDLDDAELLALADQIEGKYQGYEGKITVQQQANRTYYLGRQKEGMTTTDGQPIAANLLFEAVETFLPAALSKNPEPVTWTDNTTEGNAVATTVKTMLQYHADTLALRPKLAETTRRWLVDLLGVLKHGWDDSIQEISTEVRDVKKFIFDIDGYVDVYGDFIGTLGERITCKASELIGLFPKHKDFITIKVDGKMGTKVVYTEWWSDEYCFYTFKGIVLDKNKNPHYNYDQKGEAEEGAEPEVIKARNHFAKAKKPYSFLSVFSFGDQPHDNTSLIEQNIPNQRRISRRTEQLDYNLSKANNSDIFSETNFTQETAKQAATALAKGNPIIVPKGGPIREAIERLPASSVGSEFFTELENSKTDLRSIFGVQGISSQQPNEDSTARGMILNQQFDSTRIGGGIGDKLEQVADNVFNWWVQLYYVYYDEPHVAAVMGQMKAVEYSSLTSQDIDRKVVVSVAADSMKPHDEITDMNQALKLWESQALDPKTLLTMLNIPDVQKTAESTVLWLLDKEAYMQLNFPEIAAQLAQLQQQRQAQVNAQAPAGGGVPESPPTTLAEPQASSDLSNVPINSQALPQ